MGCNWVVDWMLIGALAAGLFFFGCAYAGLVNWLGSRRTGYTSFLVVGGVMVVLMAVALISWQCALLTAGLFIPAGIPMIIASVAKSVADRERALRVLKDV